MASQKILDEENVDLVLGLIKKSLTISEAVDDKSIKTDGTWSSFKISETLKDYFTKIETEQKIKDSLENYDVTVDDEFSIDSVNPVQNKIITQEINNIEGQVNSLKKSVSDGKKSVADAITAQGVATAEDAEFATMATNVEKLGTNKYNAGANAAKVGTANAGDVLAGKTFTNASDVGITGTMPNRSNAIQTAIMDTSDKNKSIFRTNGTNVEVIPAVGFWGTWDWNKEKILIPASSLGITANKILKGNTICGIAGTADGGNAEKHGANIVVTIDTSLSLNQVVYLYLGSTLVTQQTATARTVTFGKLLTAGTYTVKYGTVQGNVSVGADGILNRTNYSVKIGAVLEFKGSALPNLKLISGYYAGPTTPSNGQLSIGVNQTPIMFRLATEQINLSLYKYIDVSGQLLFEEGNSGGGWKIGAANGNNEFYAFNNVYKSSGGFNGKISIDISKVSAMGYIGLYYTSNNTGVGNGSFFYLTGIKLYS